MVEEMQINVYSRATLNKPDVQSQKLSRVGPVSTWMGDHVEISGAVGI